MLSFINARNCKGSAEGRPSLSDSGLLLFLLLFQWCLKERHVGMLHQRCMTSVYNTMASLRFWSWWALCTPGTHPTYKWIPNAPTPPMHLPAGFNPLAYWMSAAYLPVPAVVPFTPASVYIYQIEGGGRGRYVWCHLLCQWLWTNWLWPHQPSRLQSHPVHCNLLQREPNPKSGEEAHLSSLALLLILCFIISVCFRAFFTPLQLFFYYE